MTNMPPDSSERPAGATRSERQHAEILLAIHKGRTSHALDLAFEHLDEFGADQSVVLELASAVADQDDSSLSIEFDALLRRIGGKSDNQNGRG
ncbi:MAG TPA: hypothetical protein VFZ97_04240 [Acidimicrobiales bacterium]